MLWDLTDCARPGEEIVCILEIKFLGSNWDLPE
jgi:hypothetical protein